MLQLLCASRKSLNQQCSKKTLIHTPGPGLQQIPNLIFRLLHFYGFIHVTTLSGNFTHSFFVYEPALTLSLKSFWIRSSFISRSSHLKKQIEYYVLCSKCLIQGHIKPTKPVFCISVSFKMYINEI